MKKVLFITGDFPEDYEVMAPWQALNVLGFRADVVCPGKRTGESIKATIHDFEGDQTYTEKPGHLFRLTTPFDDIRLQKYNGAYTSDGRSSEYLRLNKSVLDIVHYAMNLALLVTAICRGLQVLVATEVLGGRKLTGHSAVKPEVEMVDGQRVAAADDEAIADGNLVTTTTWMGHSAILRHFIT